MATRGIEFAIRGRDEAAKEVANVTAGVEKLSTALNGLAAKSQQPIIHASQMPQIRALEGETARLTQNIQALGAVGARALTPLEQEAAKLGASISTVGRGIFQSTEQFHRFLAQVRGFSPEKIVEFERRVAELLPRALGKSEMAAIKAADSFKSLDAVADKIARREFRADLFKRAISLGDRGTGFMGQITGKRTTQELEQVERQIRKIETASRRGADAAKKHQMSLHDMAKSATTALERALSPAIGGVGAALVGGAVGGFAAGAAIQGIQQLQQAITGLVRSTGELALEQRKINIETLETGLSVESLETMQHAAAATGIELTSLSMGMRRLADNITEKAPAFEALGIATKDVNGELRSTDDLMRDLFDVFKNTTNATQRMQLASEFFGGRLGNRLIPLLSLGREGFEALTEQGKRLGVVLSSDVDAALVRHADQISITKESWRGLGNLLKVELLPVFGFIDNASGALVASLRKELVLLHGLAEFARIVAQGPGMTVRAWTRRAEPAVSPETARTPEQEMWAARVTRALAALKDSAGDTTETVKGLFASVGKLATTDRVIDSMAASFRGTRHEIELMIEPLLRGGQALDQSVVQKIIDRAPLIHAAIRQWGGDWRFVMDVAGEAGRQFEKVPEKIRAIGNAMLNLGQQSRVLRDEVVDAAQRFENLLRVTDRQTAARTVFENLGRDASKFGAVMSEVEARADRLRESLLKLPKLQEIIPEFGPDQINMLEHMMGTLKTLRGPESIQPIRDLFEGVPEAWDEAASRLLAVMEDMSRGDAIESLRPLLTDEGTSKKTKSVVGGLIVRNDIQMFKRSLREMLNVYNAFSRTLDAISQSVYASMSTVFSRLRDETQTLSSAIQTIIDGMVSAVLAKLAELAAAALLSVITNILGSLFGLGTSGGRGMTSNPGGVSGGAHANIASAGPTTNITNVYAWDVRDAVMQRMSPSGGLRRSGERVRIVRTY
jgi:hypothetical protein